MESTRSPLGASQTLEDLEALHEDLIRRLDDLDQRILKIIAEFQPGGNRLQEAALAQPATKGGGMAQGEDRRRAA